MWYAVYDKESWAISRKPLEWGVRKYCASFNEAKEFVSRRLRERRAEAMRPVIAIDADLRRLASMEEPTE